MKVKCEKLKPCIINPKTITTIKIAKPLAERTISYNYKNKIVRGLERCLNG